MIRESCARPTASSRDGKRWNGDGDDAAGAVFDNQRVRSGRVLVLDAQKRQGLVTVRSLGRAAGLSVTAGSHRRYTPGGCSRHADRRLRYPDPRVSETDFVASVERELETRAYDAVLPMTNRTLETLVADRSRIETYTRLPFAPTAVLDHAFDKAKTIRAAREIGLSHPTTLVPDGSEDLDLDHVAREIGYPVVVKHRRGAGGAGVAVCGTPTELETAYARIRDRYGPPLVQKYVPNGGERGVYTFYDESSTLRGLTVQHRLRSSAPDGGSSTLRETVTDPDLVAEADRLLTHLGWQGPAMVEFRIDSRTGEPLLMEINPRFWGSLALSVAAGVDFPSHAYDLAVGRIREPRLDYRVGVQARHLMGDLAGLLAREDAFTPSAIGAFVRPAKVPRSYDVCSFDDPLPAFVHTLGEVIRFARRRR